MQYAGKATKTVDEDFNRLSSLFQELTTRSAANEKALQLHFNSVLAIMDAMQSISSTSASLFHEGAKDGHAIYTQAAEAVNGVEMGDPPVRTESVRAKFVEAYEQKVWAPLKSYRLDLDM
eukprot:COSAG01_NODE_34145_length_552_cov_1.582781_1_plen_119_part_10